MLAKLALHLSQTYGFVFKCTQLTCPSWSCRNTNPFPQNRHVCFFILRFHSVRTWSLPLFPADPLPNPQKECRDGRESDCNQRPTGSKHKKPKLTILQHKTFFDRRHRVLSITVTRGDTIQQVNFLLGYAPSTAPKGTLHIFSYGYSEFSSQQNYADRGHKRKVFYAGVLSLHVPCSPAYWKICGHSIHRQSSCS